MTTNTWRSTALPHLRSLLAQLWRITPATPEGLAASGISLGEIACLSPDEALHRLHGAAKGLTPDEVKARLRSVGPNQVAQAVHHTIIGELARRSINPLNLLLLTLAAASYLIRRSAGRHRDCGHGGAEHLAGFHPGTSFEQGCRRAATDGTDHRDRAPAGSWRSERA